MDALLRGSLERFLDNLLTDTVLTNALNMFNKGLAPTVKNTEDALFGYVIGRTIEFAFDAIQVYYRRMPIEQEFEEIGKMLERRAIEIKSKIKLITNR